MSQCTVKELRKQYVLKRDVKIQVVLTSDENEARLMIYCTRNVLRTLYRFQLHPEFHFSLFMSWPDVMT